jgi:biotin carboxyl carrier protein
MKWRVEAAALEYLLELRRNSIATHYRLDGSLRADGAVSIEEVMPGLYSILEGSRSSTVRVSASGDGLEAWVNGRRLPLAISDPRDTSTQAGAVRLSGLQEVRALMPGKVVKLLVSVGDEVEAGAGVIVVEAMKMQNELRAPKTGRVKRIHKAEGSTVGPGEALLEIE